MGASATYPREGSRSQAHWRLPRPACSSPVCRCSSHLRGALTSCWPLLTLLALESESHFQHYSNLLKTRLQSTGRFGAILQLSYRRTTKDTGKQSAAVPQMTCETLGKTLRVSSSLRNKDDTYCLPFFLSSVWLQTVQHRSCLFLGDCTATNNSELYVTLTRAKTREIAAWLL